MTDVWRAVCLLAFATALHAQTPPLNFADVAGWWTADAQHGGESSRLVLHLFEKDGKPAAQLSLAAIGAYGVDLGAVTLSGNSIDTKPLSFPLTWDAARKTLSGNVPKDAAPIYQIPVEFTRGEPLLKPAPPTWELNRPTIKWSVDVGGPVWAGLERDKATGLLFVGNESGVLHAIDANGSVRWRFEAGRPMRGRPAVIQDSLYVTSDTGDLHRLDLRTGEQKWRVKVDSGSPARIPPSEENSRWDRYGSSVVADDRQIYFASRDGNLYALDRETGREVWRVAAGDMMTATPALYRDTVLFAAFDGRIRAVAARDGKTRWHYDAKLAVPGDLVIDGDRVLAGSRTYDLIALDAATGREVWKHYYWFSWIESPPVVRDGVVYTGSSDATQVYAINATDGSLRWKTPVPGWSWARTAVSDDLVVAGTVGVGSYPGFRSGSLVGLDRRTGAIRWLYLDPPSPQIVQANKGWGFGASPLIAEGIVYAADLNGRVYAFEL